MSKFKQSNFKLGSGRLDYRLILIIVAGALISLTLIATPTVADDSQALDQSALPETVDEVEIIIEQQGLLVTAKAPQAAVETWKHRVIQWGETCDSQQFQDLIGSLAVGQGNQLQLPDSVAAQSDYNKRWACFEATTASGIAGYDKLRIDLTAPLVAITQTQRILTASSSAEDLDSTTWQFSEPRLIVDCDGTIGGWSAGQIISETWVNHYYCFRVADKVGNFGYAAMKVDVSPPTLGLTQQPSRVIASGAEIRLQQADRFGESVALDGDRLAVGLPYDDGYGGLNTGAVYIFKKVDGIWSLEQEISDQATGFTALETFDYFGLKLALSGDRLAVSAPYGDGQSGVNTGAVYIFKRTGDTWALEQEISDQATGFNVVTANDWFGISLSLDGDRLAVGATGDDGYYGGSDTGAVYIFKRTGNTWSLEQEISDTQAGFFSTLMSGDLFGHSVALDGDRLAVGARGDQGYSGFRTGAVYIFKRTDNTWSLEQAISDQAAGFTSLAAGDQFGYSVDLKGDWLVVGAPYDSGASGASTGALYAFKRIEGIWVLQQEISDRITGFTALEANQQFGRYLTLSGEFLAAGVPYDQGHSGFRTGAVYVFKLTNGIWALEQKISDTENDFSALESRDTFGRSLALDGQRLAVGALYDDGLNYPDTGAVYTFQFSEIANWDLEQELSERGFVVADSWQHFKTTDALEPDCQDGDEAKFGMASSSARSLAISVDDQNQWVCFRAKNFRGVYGYAKLQISL